VFLLIGMAIVLGSIVVAFIMEGGRLAVLMQVGEFLILGGAALGSLLVGNGLSVLKRIVAEVFGLLKPPPFSRTAYVELLQVLYDMFYTARRDGLVGIEGHIEDPEKSELFRKYPTFHGNEHAVAFLADTMKVMLTGAVEDHHLSEILELDLDRYQEEALVVPNALNKVADAMPGFGIVAAVLGVVITMGKIGGSAADVGESIAAALVGTFLGILSSYGILGPMAQAIESRVRAEDSYMRCIRTALLSFSRGDPPITSVEFARRNIEPEERPSFSELEQLTRRKGK